MKKKLIERIVQSTLQYDYKEILAVRSPPAPSSYLWVKNYMPARLRASQAESRFRDSFLDYQPPALKQREEETRLQFRFKPLNDKQRVERAVSINKLLDLNRPAHNYQLQPFRSVQKQKWINKKGFRSRISSKDTLQVFLQDPYQGGFQQTGSTAKVRHKSKEICKLQFLPYVVPDGMGRRTCHSLRSEQSRMKLKQARGVQEIKHYKQHLREEIAKGKLQPIPHSQNYYQGQLKQLNRTKCKHKLYLKSALHYGVNVGGGKKSFKQLTTQVSVVKEGKTPTDQSQLRQMINSYFQSLQ